MLGLVIGWYGLCDSMLLDEIVLLGYDFVVMLCC